MIKKRLRPLFKPELYHGWLRSSRYFEGWYYKVINADQTKAFAFIPGIAMDNHGKRQAFIQVLDGKEETAEYHKFSADDFKPKPGNVHEVSVGESQFSREEILLNLPSVEGRLRFHNHALFPSSLLSPGVMGPLAFVPFMQCNHGVISMDHDIEGSLRVKDETIDFTGGRGYLEKDWGRSFPRGYVWMQTNHFSQPGVSMNASVADVPLLGLHKVGFFATILLPSKRIIRFYPLNFSRLRKAEVTSDLVSLVIENRRYLLTIKGHRPPSNGTSLAAPIQGLMSGKIEESLEGKIEVTLYDKKQRSVLLEDTGVSAGLEVAGELRSLLT